MEEQPVALATISRSPNNWEINFTYGVSPQPAQAPENSNNGCANCEFFTLLLMSTKSCLLFTFFTQYSQFGASASSCSNGTIVSALPNFGLPGHTSAQLPQPKQSITLTWMRKFMPFMAAGAFISITGALKPFISSASRTNGRIEA